MMRTGLGKFLISCSHKTLSKLRPLFIHLKSALYLISSFCFLMWADFTGTISPSTNIYQQPSVSKVSERYTMTNPL